MRPQDIIGIKSRGQWKPAASLIADWRRKNLAPPIPYSLVIASGNGETTPEFRGLCLQCRPDVTLPTIIIRPDGRPTQEFFDAWER